MVCIECCLWYTERSWNLLVLSHTLVVTTLMFSRYLWRCRATRKNYAANQWTRDEENPRANQEGKKIYSCECQLVSIIVVLFPPWIVFKDTVCTVAAHSPWLGFPIHSSRTDTSSRWRQVSVWYVHLIHSSQDIYPSCMLSQHITTTWYNPTDSACSLQHTHTVSA